MPASASEEIREIIAELGASLVQIRCWREFQGATAPDHSSHQIDDELLEVSILLAAGLKRIAAQVNPGEVRDAASRMNLPEIKAQIDGARSRIASASIAQINEDARRILNKVGPRILQKHFPEYGKFTALLGDALFVIKRADDSSENPPKFLLSWADQRLERLISLHKRLLSCESAAVRGKWWEIGVMLLGVSTLIVGAAGVWVALAG